MEVNEIPANSKAGKVVSALLASNNHVSVELGCMNRTSRT